MIAEFATSEANLAITVPSADGVIIPFIMALFEPVEALVVFDVVGKSYDKRFAFLVVVVAPRLYSDMYERKVVAGPSIDHLEPVVVASDVYGISNWNE